MIEGLSVETAEYNLGDQIFSQQTETLSKALSAFDGVESAEIRNSSVSVQYYPDILSKETIRRELVRLCLSLDKSDGKTCNPFKRFV